MGPTPGLARRARALARVLGLLALRGVLLAPATVALGPRLAAAGPGDPVRLALEANAALALLLAGGLPAPGVSAPEPPG